MAVVGVGNTDLPAIWSPSIIGTVKARRSEKVGDFLSLRSNVPL